MSKLTRHLLQITMCALSVAAARAHATGEAPAPKQDTTATAVKEEALANRHVSNAAAAVQKFKEVERLQGALGSAKGVFIVPAYGRAAAGVGAAGGAGILLVRRADAGWSDPVFYNTGALSVGLQAGAEKGTMVLILNNQKALDEFFKKNNFSLNAKSGITVVNWNKMAQGSAGSGDVLAWTDTKGLFGDLVTLEINDIRYNQTLNNAYYHRTLSASDVLGGKTGNPQAAPLVQAMAALAGPAH